ncbi:unnamed protein product [Cylicocyclus nassatus]|uniref:C2H2-type domain-containing protein n=1 Tax=Cylicocyclus nassatus TaxID=53992 RepID=A0AA36MB38_CYLNA|nr:unnamed protein product [Cylicocyclus nassatus]
MHKCDICGSFFSSSQNLRRHQKSKHITEEETMATSTEQPTLTCPSCLEHFRDQFDLATHCKVEHCAGEEITDIEFNNWDEFEIWMRMKEYETYTQFVRRDTKRRAHHNVYYFLCMHAGRERNVDPQEQKKRYRRSKKVRKNCPAFARAQHKSDGSVKVLSYFGHKLAQVGEILRTLLRESRSKPDFTRRLCVQNLGAGPRPKNIQPFKTRQAANREKAARKVLDESTAVMNATDSQS